MFEVKKVTQDPELGRGLFATQKVPKNSIIPYGPSVHKAIDGHVNNGMVVFGPFEYLMELAIGERFHNYASNVDLETKDKNVDLFKTCSGQRTISVSQLPMNWQTIFTADILFPFQTKILKSFGDEILSTSFPNHKIQWRNLLSSMDNVCFAPFLANGAMNEADGCFVNSFKNFKGGDDFGKANAVFKSNKTTGEIEIRTTRIVKKGEQVFADYKYYGKDICNSSWKEDALKNISACVEKSYVCNYGYDMGREYWKCGLAFVWWLHKSNISIIEANVEEALDVLLHQSYPFVADAFAIRYLHLLSRLYPSKEDIINGILARTQNIRRAPRGSAPDLHDDILELKVGDIICVFAYWNFDESQQQQVEAEGEEGEQIPLYCTVIVNKIWGKKKNRLINGLCIDPAFPESYGQTILLHGSNKAGTNQYLGHKIKFHGRKGNRKSRDCVGRMCNNFYPREDAYLYTKTEKHFPLRLCEEDDKKAPKNLAAIAKIQQTIDALQPGDLLVSIETLVGWNGLQPFPSKKSQTGVAVLFQNPVLTVEVEGEFSSDFEKTTMTLQDFVGNVKNGKAIVKIRKENTENTISGKFQVNGEKIIPIGIMKATFGNKDAVITYEGTLSLDDYFSIKFGKGKVSWKKTIPGQGSHSISIDAAQWKNLSPMGEVTIRNSKDSTQENPKTPRWEEYQGHIETKSVFQLYSSKFVKHGKGTHKLGWDNGWYSEVSGTFLNDYAHGKARKIFPNGDTYYGMMKNGYPHGHGTGNIKTGGVSVGYVGDWRCGSRHGKGRLYMSDGTVKEGLFGCGKFVKPMVLQRVDEPTAFLKVKKKDALSAKWGFDIDVKSNRCTIVANAQLHVATVEQYVGVTSEMSKEEYERRPLQFASYLVSADDVKGARHLNCIGATLDAMVSFFKSVKGTLRLRVVVPSEKYPQSGLHMLTAAATKTQKLDAQVKPKRCVTCKKASGICFSRGKEGHLPLRIESEEDTHRRIPAIVKTKQSILGKRKGEKSWTEFSGSTAAARFLSQKEKTPFYSGTIVSVCRKKLKSHKGWQFKYNCDKMMLCFLYKQRKFVFRVKYETPFQKSIMYFFKRILKAPRHIWNSYSFFYNDRQVQLLDSPKSLRIPFATDARTAAQICVLHLNQKKVKKK